MWWENVPADLNGKHERNHDNPMDSCQVENEGKREEVPGVELVVEGAGAEDADEVAGVEDGGAISVVDFEDVYVVEEPEVVEEAQFGGHPLEK